MAQAGRRDQIIGSEALMSKSHKVSNLSEPASRSRNRRGLKVSIVIECVESGGHHNLLLRWRDFPRAPSRQRCYCYCEQGMSIHACDARDAMLWLHLKLHKLEESDKGTIVSNGNRGSRPAALCKSDDASPPPKRVD